MPVFLPLRAFWPRELHDFTPPIVANVPVLSRLTGIELGVPEYRKQQVRIGRCQVDVLGWIKGTQDKVVFELQVAPADDDHLQRLPRYHVSHRADTIIWIAESFNDETRATVREWNRPGVPLRVFAIALRAFLNDAGRLKVGFEVVERPWSVKGADELPKAADCVGELHPSAEVWATLLTLYPDEARRSRPWRQDVRLRKAVAGWRVAMGVFGEEIRVWTTRPRRLSLAEALEILQPYADLIGANLGVALESGEAGLFALKRRELGARNATGLRAAAEWLREQADAHEAVLREALGRRKGTSPHTVA